MRICEICGGLGCNTARLLCAACEGTGLICLGYESEARYEQMKIHAREKAARLGWTEEVWEPVDPVANYPALGRKVRRLVTVAQPLREAV